MLGCFLSRGIDLFIYLFIIYLFIIIMSSFIPVMQSRSPFWQSLDTWPIYVFLTKPENTMVTMSTMCNPGFIVTDYVWM